MKRWLFALAACSSTPRRAQPIDDISACREIAARIEQLRVLQLAAHAQPCWITFESRDVWSRR